MKKKKITMQIQIYLNTIFKTNTNKNTNLTVLTFLANEEEKNNLANTNLSKYHF